MSEIVRLAIALTLRSPFMFQGLANAMLGIDAAHLRDERGRPVIPADQIKGVLRAACEALNKHELDIAPKDLIQRLFGAKSKKNETGDPEKFDLPDRGSLIFGDLAAKDLPKECETATTRIEIDDETGAVKSGALQVVELVGRFGQEVVFEGEFVLLAGDGVDPEKAEKILSRAMALVPAIGAFKSAGFAEVVAGKVKFKERISAALPASGTMPQDRLAYRVTFDRPILVDAERETDNLFVGAAVVPGAAFKGALAGIMKLAGTDPERGDWEKALAALRISHAFPENDEEELSGLPLPASLYGWTDGKDDEGVEIVKFADALLLGDLLPDEPMSGLTKMADGRPAAPVHPADWKGKYFAEFPKQCGFPARAILAPQPRTHVEINAATLVAEDQALFTTVAQGVLRKDRATKRKWRIVVDFRDVPPGFRAQLRQLIEGELVPVGCTGAYARFEPITNGNPPKDAEGPGRLRLAETPGARPVTGHPDRYALTLVTPALLTDPQLNPQSKTTIEDQYARHIAVETGGTLLRSYTTRRLAGGYIATRHRPYKSTYYPFVLTEAGSVFLIQGGAATKLAAIARFGLPPVKLSSATPTWKNCPYLRENGYGEAAFSLVQHGELAKLARAASHV